MIATQQELNRMVYITIIIRRKIAMAIILGRVLVYPRTDYFAALINNTFSDYHSLDGGSLCVSFCGGLSGYTSEVGIFYNFLDDMDKWETQCSRLSKNRLVLCTNNSFDDIRIIIVMKMVTSIT